MGDHFSDIDYEDREQYAITARYLFFTLLYPPYYTVMRVERGEMS